MTWPLLFIALLGGAVPDSSDKDFGTRIDLDASWGIGSQMFLGGQLHILGQRQIWKRTKAKGSFDITLRIAYGNEATFLAPWIDPETITAKKHRLQVQIGFGHAFHLGAQGRLAVGLYLLSGYNGYFQNVTINYDDESFSAQGQQASHSVLLSGELNIAYRLTSNFGLNFALGAPFPTQSNFIVTMLHTSLGLSLYF